MSNQDPEWANKAQVHNTLTILNLSRVVQPLIMFGILYWVLGFATDFSKAVIIGLAFLVAFGDYLALTWLVNKIESKNKTIG